MRTHRHRPDDPGTRREATNGNRRGVPPRGPRPPGRAAWRILSAVAILGFGGCSLFPVEKSVSFHEHRVQREEAASHRIADKRDYAEFLVAHQRWMQQDIRGCREQLEIILARNPKHCDARLLMADVLLSAGQPQEALGHVQEAMKHHAENPDVQYAMGLTLDANGRTDDALAYYERAAKATPGNEAYALSHRTASEAARQRSARRSPGVHPAVARNAMLPRISPSPLQAKSAGTAEPASSALQEVSTGPAGDSADRSGPTVLPAGGVPAEARPAQLCSGVMPISSGPSSTAMPMRKDPSAELIEKGRDALAHGSPKLAIAWFRKAADCDPQNPQIPITTAMLAIKLNDPQMAIEILTPAKERFPQSAAVHRTLGMAHFRTNDFSASQKDLDRAISLDKSHALSYFLMGCTMAKLGQLEAADAHFRQAETLDSRYAVNHEAVSRSGW